MEIIVPRDYSFDIIALVIVLKLPDIKPMVLISPRADSLHIIALQTVT